MSTHPQRRRWRGNPSFGKPITAAAAVSVALVLSSAPSFAAFTQATCTTDFFDTEVPMSLGAAEFTKQTTTPPGTPPDMTLYNHNTYSVWRLHTNGNVQFVKPWFGHFETELNYDYLFVQEYASPPTNHLYTGIRNSSTIAPVWTGDTWNMAPTSATPSQVAVAWNADYSIANYIPSSLTFAQPQCKTNQSGTVSNVAAIAPNERHDGLLLKANDVLYFAVTQLANTPMVISLDKLAGTTSFNNVADFDLFVSSTTLPDASNFQWKSDSVDASEAVSIPSTTSNRTLYIAAHSYRGAGHFALHAYHTNAYALNRVCVPTTLTSTKRTQLKNGLALGSAYLFGMTNGNLWRNVYQISENTGPCLLSQCDICAVDDGSNTSYGGPGSTPIGYIDWHGGCWSNGQLFAHESGHACYGFPDEYAGMPAGQATLRECGHTIMANNGFATGFCSLAHCDDSNFSDAECPPGWDSNWYRIKNRGSFNFYGPDFDALQVTADPTPIWNNAQLQKLVTFL